MVYIITPIAVSRTMQFEIINEPVEVITYFDGQKMRPLRFRWRGRPYHIVQINGSWSEHKGQERIYHFHVATREAGSFELVYHNARCNWKIGRVCVED